MLDDRTIAALEFPKIIERLGRLCHTPQGRAQAGEVAPSDDLEEIRRRHTHTSEALRLQRLKPAFVAAGIGHLSQIDEHLLAA